MSVADEAPAHAWIETAWREALAKRGRRCVYPPNAIIIHEGDVGGPLYLIVEGHVQIYSTNEAGKTIVYDRAGPGDLLGTPMLDGGVRSASVMTIEKTTCLAIRSADFKSIIAADPALAMQVIFNLIRLLRSSTEHVKSLALDDVYGRVVRLLMKATPEGDRRTARPRMTHQSIAEQVGSSREMVARVMKELEKGGYLSPEDGALVLLRKPPPRW